MEKLNEYIQLETKNGFKILKDFSPWHGPGIVNYEKKCVVLNQRFLRGQIKSFTENDLIGVLYHEIGHLKYFNQHPISKKDFTEDYKTKSEYFAFKNSCIELFKIANSGDCEPLKAMFEKIKNRIKKILNNNFEDEKKSQSHINALLKLSKSKVFLECDKYLKSNQTYERQRIYKCSINQ
ncbi:MAG: hypothetical protein GXO79_10465 [Chlorobi bacterium]|nr:hypothetical protein [Chlorobiota bacterium]